MASHSLLRECCRHHAHPSVATALAVAVGKQGVEEGVDIAVAIGQAGDTKIKVGLGSGADAQPLSLVQPGQLPGPEGEETGPVGHHDDRDPEEDVPCRGLAGCRLPQALGQGLVCPGQASVDDAQHCTWCQDAGGEQHHQVEPES